MDSSLKDSLNFEANLNSFQANSTRNILSREQSNPSALCTVFLKFKFEVKFALFQKSKQSKSDHYHVHLECIQLQGISPWKYQKQFIQKSVNS